MSYFIVENIIESKQSFIVDGEEAIHLLKSRRIEVGEYIEVQDPKFKRYRVRVDELSKRSLTVFPIEEVSPPKESEFKIHLCQALVKEKALDFILQKSTELGVASILIFQSKNSQGLKKDVKKQLTRWTKICWEACKQSGRVKPPEILFFKDIKSLSDDLKSNRSETSISLETSDQKMSLKEFNPLSKQINLLVGPEGGWTEDELDNLNPMKAHLGARILRSDTAAISAVGILQFLFGDMDPA